MTDKTILIIDGDLVAYVNSAAVEKRKVEVTHKPSGRVKEFGTRTDFKESLNKKNFEFKPDDYEYRDIQIPGLFSLVERNISNLFGKLKEVCWPDTIEIYQGEDSVLFRHELPLPTPYKDNRSSTKPIMLRDTQQMLYNKYDAKPVRYIETDDMITIRAYEELAKGNIPVIATIDKDAMQSQGVGILNWNDDKLEVKYIDSLGEIHKHKTTYKGSGIKFLAYQALAGDPTDTYKPYDLSTIPYGPARAFKAIDPCKTEKEVLEVLISEYKRMFPGKHHYTSHNGVEVIADWKLMLRIYWQCAYMMRSHDDKSNFWDYASKYGIRKEDYDS